MRFLILLLGLLLPASAWATCIPSQAPAGSIGCQPLASNPQLSDYFLAWQPSLFPFSARLMSFQQLQALIAAGSSPGGAVGNVQYNNGGTFGGLTNMQLTADINAFTSSLSGAVPASGGGTTNFLRADGTWAVPPGGGGGSPGGTNGQVQFNNAGAFGGFTLGGDGTLNTSTGALTIGSIGGKSVSLGGALTTSGSFPLTFTLGASTSLTLPASGTLLTTTGNGGSLTGLAYSQFPALSANQVLGATSATTPSGLSIPSCPAGALSWTSGTGFGCNSIPLGTVTSVGLSMPGIFSVSGSPVTGSGTLAVAASGTSGGIPYFSASNALSSSAALTANAPVIGGGAGAAPTVGSRSGNTTTFATTSGSLTVGDCAKFDASGNVIDAGVGCGAGGGGTVTSVGLSLPSIFSVSGSPVTTSGTLTGALATETANTVLAGPSSGVATTPTFRSLVAADLPGSGATTVNGTSCALGSACTVTGAPSGAASGDLSGSYPSPTVAQVNGASIPASAAVLSSNASKQLTAAATTGSGSVVLATSPTLTTPNLGTPSAITLTNGTALPLSGLASQAANTVAGNGTASSASPTALAVPSCSGASNALTWTSGTGFGCNTISGGGSSTIGSSLPGGFKAGRFYGAVGITGQGTSNAQAGRLIAIPFYNGASIALQTITFNVTTVGTSAQIRAAIYTDNGSGAPGTPIANTDTGAMSVTATGLLTSATLGGTLPAGWLWYVVEINNTTAAFSGVGFANGSTASIGVLVGSPDAAHAIGTSGTASVGVYVSHSFGTALPSPYGTPLDEEGIIPLAVLGF